MPTAHARKSVSNMLPHNRARDARTNVRVLTVEQQLIQDKLVRQLVPATIIAARQQFNTLAIAPAAMRNKLPKPYNVALEFLNSKTRAPAVVAHVTQVLSQYMRTWKLPPPPAPVPAAKLTPTQQMLVAPPSPANPTLTVVAPVRPFVDAMMAVTTEGAKKRTYSMHPDAVRSRARRAAAKAAAAAKTATVPVGVGKSGWVFGDEAQDITPSMLPIPHRVRA